MFVPVSGGLGEAETSVEDAENLKELSAEFRGVDDDAAAGALAAAALGAVDGDHVWLSVSRLHAAGDGSSKWNSAFDRMVAYAAGKGWTSTDRSLLRAHIVRS
jgi:hypothetical protein